MIHKTKQLHDAKDTRIETKSEFKRKLYRVT